MALIHSFSAAIVTAALSVSIAPALGADAADPSYQTKLRVSPHAVDENGLPTEHFSRLYNVSSEFDSEQLAYFDTPDGFYDSPGWTIRLRLKEDATSYDLTYKRRMEIGDNSLSKETISAGLKEAHEQNFDASDTNYEPQVNTSFSKSTLDFSNKKSVECAQYDCAFPSESIAKFLVASKQPGKLEKDSGTVIEAANPTMSSVVTQNSWRVEIDGIKTDLEVTEIGGEFWVEISEEDGSRKDTIKKRAKLLNQLRADGFLMEEDAFKSQYILSRN